TQRRRRQTALPLRRARRCEGPGNREGSFPADHDVPRTGRLGARMMEAEGEFAGAALRFSVALAQRDFHAELHRLFRSHGWAQTLPAMRLRVLKAHKDRCTFEVSLDTANGWQSVIGKEHDVDRSDVVGVMQPIVDVGFGPTAEFAIPRPLTYVLSLHVLLEDKVHGTQAMEI